MSHSCVYFQALFILIPILGCPYLLTLVGPSRNKSPQAYIVFQIVRAVVLSTQARLAIFTSLFLANNTTLGSGDQPSVLLSEWRSAVCHKKPLVQVENGALGGQGAKLRANTSDRYSFFVFTGQTFFSGNMYSSVP